MSPLRWTCKSTRTLARELGRQGFRISRDTAGRLLRARGSSLQANRKMTKGKPHPDRDAQFRHINRHARACQTARQPVISVDTKKKESSGNMKNPGRTDRRKRNPRKMKARTTSRTEHFPKRFPAAQTM